MNTHGYGENIVNKQFTAPDDLGGNDDELSSCPSWRFTTRATCPAPTSTATAAMCAAIAGPLHRSLRRSYCVLERQDAALWALIYATVEEERGGAAAAGAAATGARSLQRYPLELVG